jgi:transposase
MAPTQDIATRAFVLGLKCCGTSTTEAASISGVSIRQVNRIYARALKRGFDPSCRPVNIKDDFVKDEPRPGRPSKQTKEMQEKIVSKVRRDRYGREKTCADISGELSAEGIPVSSVTV